MPPLDPQDLDHVLGHTAWEDLRGARIFVTGGTGFFGCWLLETFAWACDRLGLDARVTALTRSPEAFCRKVPHLAAHPSIQLLAGDIRSFAFPEGAFTHVVHAATPSTAPAPPLEMYDTVVEGTRRALDFAAAAGVERFLLTSSGAVYGPQPSAITHLAETWTGLPDLADPRSAYAEGKRAAELLCAEYRDSRVPHCAIARCFAFAGPHLPLDAHFAIGNFIGNCLRGEPIAIRGDGTPYRSYLYAADLAVWLWTILLRGEPCRPYNVGSERALTIAELAQTVAATLAPGTPISIAQPAGTEEPQRYVPSTARAREELHLEERIPLEEATRRTAAWWGRASSPPPAF